jgi:predicted alpha/beta hydrolase
VTGRDTAFCREVGAIMGRWVSRERQLPSTIVDPPRPEDEVRHERPPVAASETVVAHAHRVPAGDGYDLAATVTQPGDGARDWVIVSGAFAVAARFYARYATALAEAGLGAVTYDYRGIGASRPASLRRFPATIADWAVLDMAGVTAWVHATQAPRRLFMVGHSLGGILPGLMGCPELVDALVTVGSENVYWRYRKGRIAAAYLSRSWLTPPITAAFGYVPWSRFARGEDVPGGAAR